MVSFTYESTLILDETGTVVARGLPDLFDLSERQFTGPYTVTEKYDGVHVLVFQYKGDWQFSTRAAALPPIALIDTSALLPDKTYCYELIGPSFRNVIAYEKDAAIPLYAIDTSSGILEALPGARKFPSDMAPLHLLPYMNIEGKEGFVVHFQSGVMVRVLFEGYIEALRLKEKLTSERILRYFRNNTALPVLLKKHHRGLHPWIRVQWEQFTSEHVDYERTVNALYLTYSADHTDLHEFVQVLPTAYKSSLIAKFNCEHSENLPRYRLIYRQSLFQHLTVIPPKKSKLILMVGVSGSGKTKWATQYRRTHPDTVILCRTSIRKMIFGTIESFNNNEKLVTQLQSTLIKNLLTQSTENGITIIVDNSNLQRDYIEQFVNYFSAYAEIILKVMPLPMSRDSNHQTALFNQLDPRVIPLNIPRVVQNPNLPECVVFDIDGTLSERHPSRLLFEFRQVGLDFPVKPVIDAARDTNKTVFIVSGRPEKCRAETEDWLAHNGVTYEALYMRPMRDNRRDYLLKKDIWLRIAEKHFITAIYEDRACVVDLGRALGFTVLQVKDGN